MKQPELHLDSLRRIYEAENIINRSYNEVDLSNVQTRVSWMTIRKARGGMFPVAISISFWILFDGGKQQQIIQLSYVWE